MSICIQRHYLKPTLLQSELYATGFCCKFISTMHNKMKKLRSNVFCYDFFPFFCKLMVAKNWNPSLYKISEHRSSKHALPVPLPSQSHLENSSKKERWELQILTEAAELEKSNYSAALWEGPNTFISLSLDLTTIASWKGLGIKMLATLQKIFITPHFCNLTPYLPCLLLWK